MLLKALALTLPLASIMYAPGPTPPPIKMGLWEAVTTVTLKGEGVPDLPPRTIKVKQCMTPESWAKSFAGVAVNGCTRSNEKQTDTQYSGDVACADKGASGHFDLHFPNAESGHGTVTLQVSTQGQTMNIDSTVDMKFLAAACGPVSPDHPVIEP